MALFEEESSDEDIILLAAVLDDSEKKQRKRRWWVRPWLSRRNQLGAHHALMQELISEDESTFRNFLRMDVCHFQQLLAIVAPAIEKQTTHLRRPIPPEERLAVTLRFLASGDSYQSLHYLYRIGRSTLSDVIPQTCRAIVAALKDRHLKVPNTAEDWEIISRKFEEKWNFPHCIGAIDGKHIAIKAPPNSGSVYYNYKDFYSIILLAVVDANYKFTMYKIGSNGRQNDSGIFGSSEIGTAIMSNSRNFPEARPITASRSIPVPYVFVGDDAFPLKENLMKPYPQRGLDTSRRIFNYRLSRARRVVENAFGILSSRFRVLSRTINLEADVVTEVAEACVALHNFLKGEGDIQYVKDLHLSCENNTHAGPFYRGNNATVEAHQVRDELCNYFNTDGQVEFQWNHS